MKHFLIKYQFKEGTPAEWHQAIARFIAALEADPELKGRISYRCTKRRDGGDYYHLAAAADDQAIKILQSRSWFPGYTDETKRVAGGTVEVFPLEIIAETTYRA